MGHASVTSTPLTPSLPSPNLLAATREPMGREDSIVGWRWTNHIPSNHSASPLITTIIVLKFSLIELHLPTPVTVAVLMTGSYSVLFLLFPPCFSLQRVWRNMEEGDLNADWWMMT